MAPRASSRTTIKNQDTPNTQTPVKSTETPKQVFKASEIDLNEVVTVKNGFQGKLIYVSKKTGESYEWENFGDEQDMTIGELRNAKNSSKGFFINNWFMFDEDWIPEFLGMKESYKHAVSVEEFDTIFDKPADEVEEIISSMSRGQKSSVAYRARNLISEGKIDSNKTIQMLEKVLNTTLIER